MPIPVRRSATRDRLGQGEVERHGHLEGPLGAADREHVPALRLDQRRVVGGVAASPCVCASTRTSRRKPCGVCIGQQPSSGRSAHRARPTPGRAVRMVSRTGTVGTAASAPVSSTRQHAGRSRRAGRTRGRRRARAPGRRRPARAASAERDRILPGRTSGDDDGGRDELTRPGDERRRRRDDHRADARVCRRSAPRRARAGCGPRLDERLRDVRAEPLPVAGGNENGGDGRGTVRRHSRTCVALRPRPRRAPRRARSRPCPRSCPRRARAR